MPSLSTLATLPPYHILSYGTLLGSGIFQSFIGGIIAFKTLPRPSFSQLQQATFPVYFGMQALLPVVLALTFPGSHSALASSIRSVATQSGLAGVMASSNRWTVAVPIATMFIAGLANWLFIGPATTQTMRERKHQETRDGKKYYDAGPHSDEIVRLNKKFGALHGISTLVNLAGLLATVFYGVVLSERL